MIRKKYCNLHTTFDTPRETGKKLRVFEHSKEEKATSGPIGKFVVKGTQSAPQAFMR